MKKAILVLAMLGLAACGDGATDPPDNGVRSVLVRAALTTLTVGATTQATASAFSADGDELTNVTFQWSSSDPTVATVSQTGLVTGVAVGTATIRARSGSITGELDVTVDVDRCTTPLSLARGEVRILGGPSAVSCITVAPSAQPSDYLFIAANALPAQDDLRMYTVSAGAASPTLAADASLAPAGASVAADAALQAAQAGVDLHDRFEDRLRRQEEALFAGRRPAALRRAAAERSPGVNASVAAAMAAVGDTVTLNVPHANSNDLCRNFTPVRAEVKAIGQKALIVQDIASPPNGFTASDFVAISSEFDDLIYAIDTLWFGSPSDVNGDGKITILYTPEVNKLTPAGSSGFVGGFFFGADLFPKSIPAENYTCDQSNDQEIFYLLAPDPEGTINQNRRSSSSVRQGTRGTIAHEFQHMINQGVRMFNPAVTSLETSWLNEGLSHLAEEAVGRAIRGFGDSQRLDFAQIRVDLNDYDAFFRQNLLRFRSWMQRPDTASPISSKARNQLAPRGAAWAFVRYVLDRHASTNPRAFTRALVFGPETDVLNIERRANASFEDILPGFLIANFATELGIPGLAPKYTYASWAMRDVMTNVGTGTFPLLVTALPTQVQTQSLSGSGNYFRLARLANAPQTTFRMLSTSGQSVDFSSARVYVLRLD